MMVVNPWSYHFVDLLSRPICQLTISFHHISWHDLPHRKTMEKYEDFEGMVIYLLSPAEIRDSNMVL